MKKFYMLFGTLAVLGCFIDNSYAQRSQTKLTDSETSSNVCRDSIAGLLTELAAKQENQSEMSLTPEEQTRLQEAMEEETVVPKKNGLFSGFGRSPNLSEGLTFEYGMYFREYFYNIISLMSCVTNELDNLKKSIDRTNTAKGTKSSSILKTRITSLKQ